MNHRPSRALIPQLPRAIRCLLMALISLAMLLPAAPGTVHAAPPPDFEDVLVADVSGPMDVAWTPDGRMLIIGKGGHLRVYQGGALLPTPALDLAAKLMSGWIAERVMR